MEGSYERPQQQDLPPLQEPPLPGLPELSGANPDSPGSPMQLDFILNDPTKPPSPRASSSPFQTTIHGSESPSPRKRTRPHQPTEATERRSSPSSPFPTAQPQSQDTLAHNTRGTSTTTRQTITKFEAITAHTAKCDLCNRRNDAGMSRCLACGWQSCHSCTLKNGCTRTHKAGSRAHMSPIDSRELVSETSGSASTPRGKKKTRGRGGKSRGRGGPSRSRVETEKEREKEKEREREDRESSAATIVDAESGAADGQVSSSLDMEPSQRDMMVEGARNLFAFSLEAYMSWTQEHKEKGREDSGSDSGAFAGIEDFHSYAQEEANRVFGQYSQNG